MTFSSQYHIRQIAPYINWSYFFHAWDFPSKYGDIGFVHDCIAYKQAWVQSFPEEERSRATEALRLYTDAQGLLQKWSDEKRLTTICVRLLQAFSEADDVVLPDLDMRVPFLRQQQIDPNKPSLCLADFVRPYDKQQSDMIGFFAATTDKDMVESFRQEDYLYLLAQTLADRLAEATAELGHLQARTTWWGYAPNEHLSTEELFQERFQGIRPAVGYPSMPDQSLVFLLDKILNFENLGIMLTENGAMIPHASVCGLMISHPLARHFSVGKVGEDQLQDYAKRREVDVEWLRRFL